MTHRLTWRGSIAGSTLALIAYVLTLIVLAPATLVDAGLLRASAGKLRLAQAHGTVWSGAGRIEIRDPSGQRGIGKDLAWKLKPWGLRHGRLDFDIAIDHARKHFPVRLSPRRIAVSDVDMSLPASVIGVAVPRIAALGPRGTLAVHITTLAATREDISLDAVVTWMNAASTLTPVAPLGNYELRVGGAAGSMNAALRTLSGPLQLEGGGSWGSNDALPFSVTARIDAQNRTQLAPLLRLISVERGNGEFVLQFSPPLAMVRR